MKSITEQVLKQRTKIDKANMKIGELQTSCTHTGVLYKFRGNTGNYDPSDNSYWIEWDCPICTRRWTTPQDNAALNKIQELDGVRVQ